MLFYYGTVMQTRALIVSKDVTGLVKLYESGGVLHGPVDYDEELLATNEPYMLACAAKYGLLSNYARIFKKALGAKVHPRMLDWIALNSGGKIMYELGDLDLIIESAHLPNLVWYYYNSIGIDVLNELISHAVRALNVSIYTNNGEPSEFIQRPAWAKQSSSSKGHRFMNKSMLAWWYTKIIRVDQYVYTEAKKAHPLLCEWLEAQDKVYNGRSVDYACALGDLDLLNCLARYSSQFQRRISLEDFRFTSAALNTKNKAINAWWAQQYRYPWFTELRPIYNCYRILAYARPMLRLFGLADGP